MKPKAMMNTKIKTHALPILVLIYVSCFAMQTGGQVTTRNSSAAKPRLVSQQNAPSLEFAAFSPDATLLITSSQTDITQVWEVATGRIIREFPAEPNRWHINGDSFVALAVSHDNRTLAIYYQGIVRLYDIASGRRLKSYPTGSRATVDVQCMRFSRDKALLYLESVYRGPDEKWVSIRSALNLATKRLGSPRRTETTHWGCFDDQEAEQYLRSLGGEFATMEMDRGFNKVIAVSMDKDLIALGQAAFESDGANVVRILRKSSREELRQVRGYTHTDLATEIAWYAMIESDGASFSPLKDTIRNQWPVAWDKIRTDDGRFPWGRDDVVFSANNRYAVFAIEDENKKQNFVVVEFPSGRLVGRIERPNIVRVYAISGDGRVALLHYDIGEVATQKLVNGETVTDEDVNTQLFDLEKNVVLKTFTRQDGIFETVSFSDDGTLMAALVSNYGGGDTGGKDYSLLIWDVVLNRVRKRIPVDQVEVSGVAHSLAFSPDDKQIAMPYSGTSVSNNEEVWLFDIRSGRPGNIKLRGHVTDVWEVVFSPDGRHLATRSTDQTARVWDANTGRERFRIETPGYGIRFSMDGRFVYSDTVLFRTVDGGEVGRFFPLANGIDVFVTPDGRFDVSAFENLNGLHWVMSDEAVKTVPFEIFMRIYYEPELLSRSLECNRGQAGDCAKAFKPLPSIGQINRVQPAIKNLGGMR